MISENDDNITFFQYYFSWYGKWGINLSYQQSKIE